MKLKNLIVKHLIVNNDLLIKYNNFIAYQDPHRLFNLEGTVHYNCLINNNYEDYKKLLSSTYQPEHSLDLFLKLRDSFDISKISKINCYYDDNLDKYIVTDGVHRLVIMKYLGYDNIDMRSLNNIFPDKINKKFKNKTKNYCWTK